VLDLAPLLPESLCTQMLADLGVEVIKIEGPNRGDSFRSAPPLVGTTGSFFHIVNRNKKGIKLSLKQRRGRDVFIRMAGKSDVIIENFRHGVMQQMGLGDPHIRRRGLWFKANHPVDGEIPQQAFPIKFSEDQPGWKFPPPVLGEHTLEVLRKMDFSEEEIRSLKAQGII